MILNFIETATENKSRRPINPELIFMVFLLWIFLCFVFCVFIHAFCCFQRKKVKDESSQDDVSLLGDESLLEPPTKKLMSADHDNSSFDLLDTNYGKLLFLLI